MNFDSCSQIIQEAISVHKNIYQQIEFDKEDKKHAIYLLQGAVITSVYSALVFNIKGYLNPVAQQKRMIDEMVQLIMFFNEIKDDNRHLRAWFKGRIVERPKGRGDYLTIEDRAKKYNLKPEHIRQLDKASKKLVDIVSLYSHPSIESVRVNVFKSTNTFDYAQKQTHERALSPKVFGEMYLAPLLQAFLIPLETVKLTKEEFINLRAHHRAVT